MIHWLWLIPTFFFGIGAGVFFMLAFASWLYSKTPPF